MEFKVGDKVRQCKSPDKGEYQQWGIVARIARNHVWGDGDVQDKVTVQYPNGRMLVWKTTSVEKSEEQQILTTLRIRESRARPRREWYPITEIPRDAEVLWKGGHPVVLVQTIQGDQWMCYKEDDWPSTFKRHAVTHWYPVPPAPASSKP